MNFAKSKRLKLLGASALAFLLASTSSFLLLTTNNDANARSKRTQTALMTRQKAPEASQTSPQKKKNAIRETSAEETQPQSSTPQPKPKSLEERIQDDLQKAREASKQDKDAEAFRTSCSIANTIKRNKYDETGANAEAFKQYYKEAVEIAQTSGQRLQKKNDNHDKPLVFIF